MNHTLVLWGLCLPVLLDLMVLMVMTWRYVPVVNVPDQIEQIRRRRHFLRATPLQRFPALLQEGNASRAW
jgi:hypothetical protein